MTDSRVRLLDDLVATVSKDYYSADGKEPRFYTYVWFHLDVAINVGKGCDKRYREFIANEAYNSAEARDYVRKHHKELECFFAASNITEPAALAIEYMLIGHFKRRDFAYEDGPGGTLFNVRRGQLPVLSGRDANLWHLKKSAGLIPVLSIITPLAKGKHGRNLKDGPDFAPSDKLTLITDDNPWQYNTRGWRFFEAVMRQRPATVAETIAMTEAALRKGINVGTGRSATIAQGHLKWLYHWGRYLVVNGKFWAAGAGDRPEAKVNSP